MNWGDDDGEDDDREENCPFCGGDGYMLLDCDIFDNPISMCDWMAMCIYCGGTGVMMY